VPDKHRLNWGIVRHMNAEGLADFMKEQTAIALFREGRLSSGMAAAWLGVPRRCFLSPGAGG